MNKQNKQLIKSYLKEVSSAVVCKYSVKKLFLRELKGQILDFYEENDQEVTNESLHSRFGTSTEIANGFENLKLDKYMKQARIYKIVFVIAFILVVFLAYTLYRVITESGGYIIIDYTR